MIVEILVPTWVSWLLRPLLFLGVFKRSHNSHWIKPGLDPMTLPKPVCDKVLVDKDKDGAYTDIRLECAIISQQRGCELFRFIVTYHFVANGCMHVQYHAVPGHAIRTLPSLPRVGVSMTIDKSLYMMNYFGRGPHENYPDRKSSAAMGVWTASPEDMGYNYIVPGENGARTGCEWVNFQSADGKGFCIVWDRGEDDLLHLREQPARTEGADSHFTFSASMYAQQELHVATHSHHLDVREQGKHPIHVNIDHKILGLGDVV